MGIYAGRLSLRRRLLRIYDRYGRNGIRLLAGIGVHAFDLALQDAHFAFQLRDFAQKLETLARIGKIALRLRRLCITLRLCIALLLVILRHGRLRSRGGRRQFFSVSFQVALHFAEHVVHVLFEQETAVRATNLVVIRLLSAIFTDLHSLHPFCFFRNSPLSPL